MSNSNQQFRISDEVLDAIVSIGNDIDALDIEFDALYSDAQVYEGYRVEYSKLDAEYVKASKALTQYNNGVDEDPNVIAVRAKLQAYRDKVEVLVEDDPAYNALVSYEGKVQDAIDAGRVPFTKAKDDAYNAKRSYLRWMSQPEQHQFKGAWDRVRKESAA